MNWQTVLLLWIFLPPVAYWAGMVGGRRVPHRQIAVLRRKVADLSLDVAEVEELCERLRASHSKLRNREQITARRNNAKSVVDNKISAASTPEQKAEYKKQARIKFLHNNGKGE